MLNANAGDSEKTQLLGRLDANHPIQDGIAAPDQHGIAKAELGDRGCDFTNLSRFLSAEGYGVITAADGATGIEAARERRPDLIICDILMPRLDGYQTCAIIKRNVKFAGVPVIMLSSKDGLFDKARGRMVGSEAYLTKPFTKDQLLQAVEQHRRVA